jgi:hypothetical protein
MASLIPEDDEDDEDTPRTLVVEREDQPEAPAPIRTHKRISESSRKRIMEFANATRAKPAAAKAEPKPKEEGVLATIKEGAKSTGRALGAAIDTYQGDEAEVVDAAKAQKEAPKDPRLEAFLAAVDDHKKRLGDDPSLWESIKAVGSAAIDNPAGAGLMVAEQIPNSAAALGAGAAGALAGSVAGPVGSIVGGIAGLAGANIGLETGHKAMEAAQDGSFGTEEQSRVKGEGAIKGTVLTGVDTLTLGATKFITGATARAVEKATVKTLTDKGVDVANEAAVKTAMADPAIMATVNEARTLAAKASDKLGKKIARTGGALALETIGEGVGEFVGEFAATGKASMVDAVVESLAGLSQSMGEVAFTSALNKRAETRLFKSKGTAEKIAKQDTENTGVEHEVKPHPIEPDTWIAVPKTRTTPGVELEQDVAGNLRPKAPEPAEGIDEIRTQRAELKPGFEQTSEEKILLNEKRRKNAEAYARNPLIIPGIDNVPAPEGTPTIGGKPVTGLSKGTLLYTADHGSSRAKQAAKEEIARRKTEGVDPKIADAVSTPTETVNNIIDTGAEKVKEDVKGPDIPKPTPTPATPPKPVKTPKPVKPKVVKPAKPVEAPVVAKPEPVPAPKIPEPKEVQSVPENVPVAPVPENTKGQPRPEVRPLIDALIKRHAVAHGELHRGSTFDKAMKAAKAFMAGEDVLPARFKSAADILKGDPVAVDLLNQLHAKVTEAKKAAKVKTVLPVKPAEKPKPKPEPARAPEPVRAEPENNAGIVLPDGTNLPATWDVVDADSVTASLKEGVNQPRDRGRAASDIQVQGIASNPDYRRLSHSPVMDVGAPTLSHDGLIVGGNGRFEGVSRAYDQKTATDYLAQLKADAAAKGIDPKRIDAMKKPVLVRRITTPFDTRKLAVASNSGTGMQYSAMEMAKIDAGRMKGIADLEVTDNGDIALTGSNREGIRFALGDYNAAELGALVDKDGALSQEGVRRIRNAMLYSAYGSNPTLERLVESADNDLRNVSGALVKAAGAAAKVRADIEAGLKPAELDISANIVNAVEALSKLRQQGMTVDEHLAQIGMFGDDMTDNEKDILRVLGANMRSQKKIAEFIRSYYDMVSRIDLSSGDMFGNSTPTKKELLDNAKEKITDKQPQVGSLFSRSTGTANPEGKKQPGNNESPSARGKKDRVKSVVDSIRKRWKNAPEIVIVDDMADPAIPDTVRAENQRQLSQGATGEPEGFISGGKVYLVASQLHSPEDVARVLLHESLGHFGLRGVFGQELHKILKQVSALRRGDVAAKAKQYGLDINNEADRLIAAEEVLAELAQTNPQNGIVQRAIAAIRTWLRQNIPGFENLSLSDAEIIEGILIPAREFVQQGKGSVTATPAFSRGSIAFKKWFGNSKVVDANGEPRLVYHGTNSEFNVFKKSKYGSNGPGIYFTTSRAIAASHGKRVIEAYVKIENDKDGKIAGHEVIVYKPENIKSATDNSGAFDPTNPDIRFSRSAAGPAKTPFRERIDKAVDSLIYNFQDRFKPLKDIQERAGAVDEDADAALAEERYSGMVRARTDNFEETLRDPLLKAIHDSGVAFEDVEEYLHALHAPSRNAAMREINPTESELKAQTSALEKQRDSLSKDTDVAEFLKLRRELRQAEADIEDGIADESLAVAIKSDIAQVRRAQNVKDYTAALEKLKGLRLVKPFEGDNTALSGMSDAESEAILAKADANGTRKALDRISGIVDAITLATRQIYVDGGLEKADVIEAWNKKYEHYIPLHRDEVSGQTMPKTGQGFNIRGKESKRATGSTKEVTNILAHVVAQHEAAIIRAEKSRVDRTLFRFAQLNPDPELWTLDEAPMVRDVDKTTGFVVNRVDPTYKNKPEVLTLKIDGDEHTITFNTENQEAMRLVASMKNMSAGDLGEVTALVGKFTRFLATMNTTMNPVFTARNFLRDLQTAYVNLTDTAIADKKKDVFLNVGNAIKGMWDLSKGKHNSQWAKFAQEFTNAGGQTGWMEHYRDIGARADTLKKELAMMGPGRWNFTKRKGKALLDFIQDANSAVENGVRLSAYVNARKSGLSEGKAAQLAKNLTVNFNTHGARGVELNAWYMFMNASIQGTARLVKALSNRQVQKIVSGVVLSGFLLDVLARSMAGDEDDDGENDYDQLPEHTKAMNFVFMVGGSPVTIPMPYGYNFFASTGRKVSEMMFRENYSAARSAGDLAGIFLDAFSPTGQAGSGLQYLSPTVTDPLVQWAENRNFAGNPLRRAQNPFGVPNPEYQMGFKSTSAPAKWLAEVLNNETGGNEVRPGFVNVNPAFFDFAVSSLAGGAGRTLLQTVSAPIKAGADDEIQAREVPFLNIFVGAKPEHQTERKYFEAVKRVETTKKELKTYRDMGDDDMVKQIREEHAEDLKVIKAAEKTKKLLTRLQRRERALEKTNPENKREQKKRIDDRRRVLMSQFNKEYAQAVAAH